MLNFYSRTTTVKDENNEDACLVGGLAASLSDGAGGCGIFCGDWAAYVCKLFLGNIPDNISGINQVIDANYQQFTSAIEASAASASAIDKFYQEGSYATLASVAFNAEASCFDVCTYGDSPVFHYREGCFHLYSSYCSLSAFIENPHLLNWIKEIETEQGFFVEKQIPFSPNDSLILTSDALGQLILSFCMVIRAMQGNEEAKTELSRTLATSSKLSVSVEKIVKACLANDQTVFYETEHPGKTRAVLSSRQIKSCYKRIRKHSPGLNLSDFQLFCSGFKQKQVKQKMMLIPESERELARLLAKISKDESLFNRYMRLCYEAGFLLRDDYTLVFIEK